MGEVFSLNSVIIIAPIAVFVKGFFKSFSTFLETSLDNFKAVGCFALVSVAGELAVSVPHGAQDFGFNFTIGKRGVFLDKIHISADETIANFCGHLNVSTLGHETIFTTELVVLGILADGFKESLPSVDELQAFNTFSNESFVEIKTAVVSAGAGNIVCGQPVGKNFLCLIFIVANHSCRIAEQVAVVVLLELAIESIIQLQIADNHNVNAVNLTALGGLSRGFSKIFEGFFYSVSPYTHHGVPCGDLPLTIIV